MSTAAAEVLSMGILMDILDDEWMRDTLPHEDVAVPSEMAPRGEDAEDPTDQENQQVEGDTWRDLAVDNQ